MDKIAERGARFSNAFATINTTDPSFTTIFTGKYPTSHGVLHHANKITEVEKSYAANLIFLPEILQEHGFVTIGIDWLGKWHKKGYDFYGGAKNRSGNQNKTDSLKKRNTKKARPRKSSSSIFCSSVLKRYLYIFYSPFIRYNWYYSLPTSARKRIKSFSRFYSAGFRDNLTQLRKSPILSDSAGMSDLAIRYIQEFAGKKDFFLFVHYWDNHIPYTTPHSVINDFLYKYDYSDKKVSSILEGLSGTKTERLIHKTTRGRTPHTVGEIMAHYDASVKYVDSNIGRIYKCLEEVNVLDDTVIIITSDHGESLVEHDIFFDHHGLYDFQVRIPLIISGHGIPCGVVYDEFVQHFDIMPTVLDIVGIKDMGGKLNGASLLKLINNKGWGREFVYAEEANAQRKRMIRDKKYKYIKALSEERCAYCQKYHFQGDEFYDLQNDPQEKENIVHDPKHMTYKKKLEEYIDSLDRPKEGGEIAFEDEEEINKKLKDLGYI
jgi:arylsulfatase A-like enzyme